MVPERSTASLGSIVTKIRERKQQFREPRDGAHVSFSPSLVTSANTLLWAALQERGQEVYRTSQDHSARNAVGAIALVVTAFDVWMSECFGSLSMSFGAETRERAFQSIVKKHGSLAELTGATVQPNLQADLELLIGVRDEIIHHLSRPLADEGNVPSWLVELHRRDLFLSTGQRTDFFLGQKLGSYRLAYWAFQTAEAAAKSIADTGGMEPATKLLSFSTAANFSRYAQLCPPERLHEFDVEHQLSVTPKNPHCD